MRGFLKRALGVLVKIVDVLNDPAVQKIREKIDPKKDTSEKAP